MVRGNHINKGLSQHGGGKTAHVSAVDVGPEASLGSLILTIFNRSEVHGDSVGEHFSTFD